MSPQEREQKAEFVVRFILNSIARMINAKQEPRKRDVYRLAEIGEDIWFRGMSLEVEGDIGPVRGSSASKLPK